jgi:hypothetical protein
MILSELDAKKSEITSQNELSRFHLYMQTIHKIILSNSNLIKAYNKLGCGDSEFKYIYTLPAGAAPPWTVRSYIHHCYRDKDV